MNEGVEIKSINRIKSNFEESNLPYRVDIVNYPLLRHEKLKDHIDRIGVPFYKVEVSD